MDKTIAAKLLLAKSTSKPVTARMSVPNSGTATATFQLLMGCDPQGEESRPWGNTPVLCDCAWGTIEGGSAEVYALPGGQFEVTVFPWR